ncbi:MAG: hypothetical protein IJ210_11385 [Clostridia bacterium]|nr:hypothetical protein [Clostridia bacterium]
MVPNVIRLKSGQCETVFDLEDLMRLIQERMGYEARCLLEELTGPKPDDAEYIEHLEKENQKLREHHREVMQALRVQSETIARLIREPEIDRKTLSTTAGVIGKITWREINVG